MEDASSIVVFDEDAETRKDAKRAHLLAGWSFFAVFDGHRGPKMSRALSEGFRGFCHGEQQEIPSFAQFFARVAVEQYGQGHPAGADPRGPLLPDEVTTVFRLTTQQIDAALAGCDVLRGRRGTGNDGSTAIMVMLSPTHAVAANIGDSRALLVRQRGPVPAVPLSTDHKPNDPTEQARIEAAGGSVEVDDGVSRTHVRGIANGLALSRAFGNQDFKQAERLEWNQQPISAEPDVTVTELTPGEDQFLLLACDGLFEPNSLHDPTGRGRG